MTTISKKNHRKPPIGGFFVRCYFVIEKIYGVGIIAGAIGVSSNGRTRDFGSLYHGSNPCAPTKFKNTPTGVFFHLLCATDCTISFSDCTAKHYQCFVRVSGNLRFPKNTSGEHPHPPVCAPTIVSKLAHRGKFSFVF